MAVPTLLALASSLALLGAPHTAVLPPLPGTLLGATGNGCEGTDSFYVTWYNDSRDLRFYLNDNIARLGAQARPSSTCAVQFKLNPPQGYKYAVESSVHYGASAPLAGDSASLSVQYQIGDAPAVRKTADVPANPSFTVAFQHGEASPWSPCGTASILQVDLGRHLSREGAEQADASIGSAARFQLTDAFRIAMKPC